MRKTNMELSSLLPYMSNRWDTRARKMAYSATGLDSHREWKTRLIQELKLITGFDTMLKCSMRPRVTNVDTFDKYTRQHVIIDTEPGISMPFFVLIPSIGTPPFPVVLAPHGHGSGGKLSPAGCTENPEIAEAVQKYNYNYAEKFAQEGFITLCPDARGFGERREPGIELLDSSCEPINKMAIPLGQTITGMWIWDLMRLIDYAETRSDCDINRLACAGLSGGGLQTLWTTAFDQRIKCAIVSGYFYGYKESLLVLHNNCWCNYVPNLYETVDMGDLGALIAPRALMIETGDSDSLNGNSGLRNVISQVNITKKAYYLTEAEDSLKHVIFEGEHRWDGTHAISWLKQWLA